MFFCVHATLLSNNCSGSCTWHTNLMWHILNLVGLSEHDASACIIDASTTSAKSYRCKAFCHTSIAWLPFHSCVMIQLDLTTHIDAL